MEDRGARANKRGAKEQYGVAGRKSQHEQPGQGRTHSDRKGVWDRVMVGVEPDKGLQHGGRDLVGQCYQSDLGKTQVKGTLEQRIDRQDERLEHVV